jgi:hypothetical protein
MKQPHTEGAVDHTGGEQDTGNHRAAQAGAPAPGGTRHGAENVEQPVTNIEKGTDVEKVADLEDALEESISVNGPTERAPERDERGRM